MLSFYAQQLPSVEINNTFYRMPKTNVLESRSEQVSDEFRFVLKASRRITHIKRLKEPVEETEYLLRTSEALGDKLGAILFQLPANLKKNADRLRAFLGLLPAGTHAALEFRHDSWFDDEIHELLHQHDCALCIVDGPDAVQVPFTATSSWGYLRLRDESYTNSELQQWWQRIKDIGWSEAFVFFKHEDAGAGPELARRFLDLAK